MSPSCDSTRRRHKRVCLVSALALMGPCWAATASALPIGSTAPVVGFDASVVLFAGGTAELDGSTTLERTRTGTRSRIDCTILFAKDSDQLLPGAGERLRRLAAQLQQQGPGRVRITGYTDDLGSAAHGLDLSRRRAQQVATTLSTTLPSKTFPMTVRGRGEANPAVPNTSESNRRKNRRVAVVLNLSTASSSPLAARPSASTQPAPRATRTAAVPTPSASAPPPHPTNAPESVEPSTAATFAPTPPGDSRPNQWPLLGAIGLALILVGALVDQIRRRARSTGGQSPEQASTSQRGPDAPGTTTDQQSNHKAAAAAPTLATPTIVAASVKAPAPPVQTGTPAASAVPAATVPPATSQLNCKGPDLEVDLAAWFSSGTHRPKLSLLGPVHARTHGQALARRKPYYTELLAYLTLKPAGATVDELAESFSLTTARVRTDMKVLRDWLGHDPATSRPYLPDARTSAAALTSGVPTYQVHSVLCDLLLLNQLHHRCALAGSEVDGSDIDTALALVSGRPFSQTRANGWGWLFEGQRFDLQAVAVIDGLAEKAAEHHHNEGNADAAERARGVAHTAGVA